MESLPESGRNAGNGMLTDPRRQLPAPAGKLERISQHTKGLFDEITNWVDLRIKLVQVELQEQFETKKIQIALGAAMGLLAFFALMFILTSAALGVGSWLGHPAWGFLIVAIVLLIVVAILNAVMKKMVKGVSKKISVDAERLSTPRNPTAEADNRNA